MDLDHLVSEGILIITPQGPNLDAKETGTLKKQIIDLITSTATYQVVFNLHHIQFMDSSGLGCFLSVLRFLNTHEGELKIACMNRSLQTLFELVSMHKIFDIFPSVEEAIESFQDSSTLS